MDARRSTLMLHDPAVAELGDFDRYVDDRHLQPAYQPIVDLGSNEIVAYEALARWLGLTGATPDAVFAGARLNGRTAELDWACRLAALQGALDAGLGKDHVLFVNVEPEALASPPPAGAQRVLDAARRDLRVMLELTERALVRRPADLLRVVEWARRQGWGIALDDVGAEPESLALLPFLAPDVVKLDMTLVRQRPTPDQASIMAAVMSHAERTGAVVLAEGIETPAHLDQALALGATLGQGWMFGRPEPLGITTTPVAGMVLAKPVMPIAVTPFSLIESHPGLRIGRKALLLDLSLHIESQGLHLRPSPVVLSAFQTSSRFTPRTMQRYERLAARCPLVAALGRDIRATSPNGVHCVPLSASDPLLGEWTVTTIGSHYAAALIARDLGDDGPDLDRRYEFLVTHDRDVVLAAARSLMSRITG
jgi:EAL domain-containing protein (putative c-di-GMP-specific phosphodiesterase class I)